MKRIEGLNLINKTVLMIPLVLLAFFFYASTPVHAEQDGDFTYTVANGEATITAYQNSFVSGEIIIPETLGGYPVTRMSGAVFNSPPNITGIRIPKGLKTIDDYVFYYCPSLTSYSVDPDNPNYASIDGILCSKDGKTIVAYPFSENNAVIPSGVTNIGNGAFINHFKLSSVSIPDSVTNIGKEAFLQCQNLESVTIPKSITSIGEAAFAQCLKLESVTIPESLTSTGPGAFSGCESLATVFLPESITNIDDGTFAGCLRLTSINIPSGVTNIGMSAFLQCRNLKSIIIPEGVKSIGKWAFFRCSLTTVIIPKSVQKIGDGAFYDCTNLESIQFNSPTTEIMEEPDWTSYKPNFPKTTKFIGYDPSTAKDYATKLGNPFQVIGNSTTIEKETKTIVVKAHDKTTGELVPVPDAMVYVYEKDNIPMCIGKESDDNKILMTGKTDANGSCTLTPPAGGWPSGANVVACKNEVFTNDGRQQARAPYDNVVFTLQTHTSTNDPNGEWFGQLISEIGDSSELIMESPRYLCNLSLTYYYNKSSGDYYDDVVKMTKQLSNQFSQATDGYFAIDKVAIYNTTNKLDFEKKGNFASESDIQIKDFSDIWSMSYFNRDGDNGFLDDDEVDGAYKYLSYKDLNNNILVIHDNSKSKNFHIQLSKKNINSKDISKNSDEYTKEVLHELGHYILDCDDEYVNGKYVEWDKVTWPNIVPIPVIYYHPNGGKNFGLMDRQYSGIELSNESHYAYLDTDDKKQDLALITWHYLNKKGSCWYAIREKFSNITFKGENPPESLSDKSLLNTYKFYIYEANNLPTLDRERLYSTYDTKENIIDGRNITTSDYFETFQPSTELMANVKVITQANGDQAVISPVKGTPVSFTQMFYDDSAAVEIPLTAVGTSFTGMIPMQKERYYLRLTSALENNETCYSDFVVRATKDTLQSSYISDDESLCVSVESATADSYNFVSQDSSISRDGYVLLTKAVYITSKDNATVNDSILVSDVASSALVDTSTIAWYKYENSQWTPLETQTQDGDYNSITAYCGISGDGYYQLMAQPAKTTSTFQPVQGLTITPNNQYDGSVNITFTDANNKDDIRYYKFYYSDQPFSKDSLEGISAQIFDTYGSSYGYTFEDNSKTYYCAIQIVGKDGSVSDLSEIKSFTTGIRDTDNDGIPETWVEQYSLRTLDNPDSAIAGLDNDADGLTNQQEYQHNTNPQKKDTDDDGVTDSDELTKGLNPLNTMSDGSTPDYLAAYGSNDFTVENVQMNTENGTNTLSISMKNLINTMAKDVNVKLIFDGNIEWFWQTDFEANKTTDLSYVFDGDMPKNIQVSIDSDHIRYDSDYSNNISQLSTTLESIAITTPAAKLNYQVGESLDLTGLVVTGTYSDGATKAETVTADNISGFDSGKAAKDQVLTITVNGKTVTYTVQIIDPNQRTLGDVDDNGSITAYDALKALQIATGKKTGTAAEITAADVDKSGSVSAYDALRILQYATGKNKTF